MMALAVVLLNPPGRFKPYLEARRLVLVSHFGQIGETNVFVSSQQTTQLVTDAHRDVAVFTFTIQPKVFHMVVLK
jgi:hypothetical protein